MKETIARANAAGSAASPCWAIRSTTRDSASWRRPPRRGSPDPAWGGHFQLLPLAVWPGGVSGTFRYAKPFGVA
ncbi:hypothetical protein PJ267_08310 [Arthrobacter sp. OVS8]|nr:hypothetical protein PJ267_08310 [Arthrobacter sp. OVS8]